MEITDIRLRLPAIVTFKQNDKDLSVFVYLDQIKMDVVIPDDTEITNVEEFKKAFAKYNKSQMSKTSDVPVFKKMNPNDFTGDYDGQEER